MSKLSEKEIDRVKKKIETLYKNFGIDTENMFEEELGRIVKHYLSNPEKIKEDLASSKANDIDPDDILY
jgi:hypothetical protein